MGQRRAVYAWLLVAMVLHQQVVVESSVVSQTVRSSPELGAPKWMKSKGLDKLVAQNTLVKQLAQSQFGQSVLRRVDTLLQAPQARKAYNRIASSEALLGTVVSSAPFKTFFYGVHAAATEPQQEPKALGGDAVSFFVFNENMVDDTVLAGDTRDGPREEDVDIFSRLFVVVAIVFGVFFYIFFVCTLWCRIQANTAHRSSLSCPTERYEREHAKLQDSNTSALVLRKFVQAMETAGSSVSTQPPPLGATKPKVEFPFDRSLVNGVSVEREKNRLLRRQGMSMRGKPTIRSSAALRKQYAALPQ